MITYLLDYEYFSKHFKLIAIDLSKQIELEKADLQQQINFISKYEDDRATMFFIIEKSEKTTSEFSQNSVSIYKMETQNIIKLLNDSSNEKSKFATKKWYVIDSQTTKGKYKQDDTIKFETETIKSSLYDYSDVFIVVTGNIKVAANNDTDFAFKNCGV